MKGPKIWIISLDITRRMIGIAVGDDEFFLTYDEMGVFLEELNKAQEFLSLLPGKDVSL